MLNLFIRHSIQGSVTTSLLVVLRDACLSASMGERPRSDVFRCFPVCFSSSLSIRIVSFFKREPFATIPGLRSVAFWVYDGFILHIVLSTFLDVFAKFRTATISFDMSVCLSVRPHGKIRLAPQGLSCSIFEYFSKIC